MAQIRNEKELKNPQKRKNGPLYPSNKEAVFSIGREVFAIILFSASLLSALSVATFHPYDPGPFSFGTVAPSPQNWVGIAGAYSASLIVHFLGLCAPYVPIFLAVLGIQVLNRRSLVRPWRLTLWASMVLSQVTFLQWAIGEIRFSFFGQEVSVALGGLLGLLVLKLLEEEIGLGGVVVVLPLWVLVTLMLFFQFSFMRLTARIMSPAAKLLSAWRVRREKKRHRVNRKEKLNQIKRRQEERVGKRERALNERPLPISERKETAPALPFEAPPNHGYRFPPADLLDPPRPHPPIDEKILREYANKIEGRLKEFDIEGEVVEIHPGPVVTIFEFKSAPGVKYSRITALEQDIAISLKTDSIRVDRVSGKSHIGIEVPNRKRELISFRELVESSAFAETEGKLPLALGKTVEGLPFITTLDNMPHLLIAGTTGSGKSVGLNAIIHSILFRSNPDEVKFILVDPKQVELKVYEGLPHLLTPVVTDVKKAANALNWAVREMTERYMLLASAKVRSIDQYNAYVRSLTPPSVLEPGGINRPLPYIVIVIDELYDLMAVVARDVEMAIARLSAMARAVGIHLILATQRPSRDVITGVIKSNLPSRIAFQVREKLESRLILDQNGAESLEGKGDMLFLPPGSGRLIRIHGGFISNAETRRVIKYLRDQREPEFDTRILKEGPSLTGAPGSTGGGELEEDPLYRDALRLVVKTGTASASNLQRKLRIGYARAARILDVMENRGIIGPADGAKPREILIEPDEVE